VKEVLFMELETTEQVRQYLAQLKPTLRFNIHPFESGWICMEDIPPQENLTRGLGMASLIIDKETGVVTVQSSQPMDLVAREYTDAKRMGRPLPGRQIYPYRWTITLHRIREDTDTIVYQMTAESLTETPEPTRQHRLTIEKLTKACDPRDPLSRRAMAHLEWVTLQNQGRWPETDMTQV
jgi:hypothetical protein